MAESLTKLIHRATAPRSTTCATQASIAELRAQLARLEAIEEGLMRRFDAQRKQAGQLKRRRMQVQAERSLKLSKDTERYMTTVSDQILTVNKMLLQLEQSVHTVEHVKTMRSVVPALARMELPKFDKLDDEMFELSMGLEELKNLTDMVSEPIIEPVDAIFEDDLERELQELADMEVAEPPSECVVAPQLPAAPRTPMPKTSGRTANDRLLSAMFS